MYKLCDTSSKEEADLLLATLKEDLLRASEETRKYVEDNWLNCADMWVKVNRYGLPTLAQDTTNRVESLNSVIKKFIKKRSKMTNCLRDMFRFLKHVHDSVAFKQTNLKYKTRKIVNVSKNDVRNQIFSSCSSYIAKILLQALKEGQACKYKVTYSDDNEDATLESQKNKVTVSKYESDEPKCSCHLSLSLMVPCKHIFFIRKLHSLILFQSSWIHPRWKESASCKPISTCQKERRSVIITGLTQTNEPSTSTKHGLFKNPQNGNGKYTETFRLFQELYKNAKNLTEAL
jgi:hypothetical protein